MSAATWEEVEKECSLIKAIIKRLPDELKPAAAERIAFEAAVWGGANPYEMSGILEEAKSQIRQAGIEAMRNEDDDE